MPVEFTRTKLSGWRGKKNRKKLNSEVSVYFMQSFHSVEVSWQLLIFPDKARASIIRNISIKDMKKS